MSRGNSAGARLKASLEDAKAGRVTRHDSVESLMQWLDAWPFVPLGKVCKTTSGGTPSRKNPDFFDGSIPWVKSGELPDGPVFDVEESISEEALRQSSAKLLPSGTLLIALYGATVGKLGMLTKPAATNQAVCAIFPPPEIDTKFLFWFLRFKRADLVAQAVGGAQPNISQGIIRGLEIPMPPLDQQKRIVAEIEKQFSRLDEAVANLKRVKANLKRYKAAVLKAAVEGKLTEAWRKQHPDTEPASELLQRILTERRAKWEEAELAKMQAKGKIPKDDAWKKKYPEPAAPGTTGLPELPEGWVWATMGALLFDIEAGKSFKCDERPPKTNEVGVVKVSAVTWGEFDEAESKTCLESRLINKNHLIRPGDFLFSRANTIELVGACVIAKKVTSSVMLSDKILRFQLPDGVNQWVLYNFRSKFGRSEIERLATGNQESMRNIGQDRIRAIRIPLPPAAEYQRTVAEIEQRLSLADEAQAQVNANLRRAERLRQSVLASAFTPPVKEFAEPTLYANREQRAAS